MENKSKPIAERIRDVKQIIIANSNDKKWAEKLLAELTSLHKQSYDEPVEVIVPTREVTKTVDMGAVTLKRTIRGILFEAKGGMSTFVGSRMSRVYGMLNQIMDEYENPSEDSYTKETQDVLINAVCYVMQAPIFASLSEMTLLETANTLLKGFDDYSNDNFTNAEVHEETEQDIKDNIAFEQANEVLENLAKTPIPPETDKE